MGERIPIEISFSYGPQLRTMKHTMMRNIHVVLIWDSRPSGAVVLAHKDIVCTHARDTDENPTRTLVVLSDRIEGNPRDSHDVRAITLVVIRILDVRPDIGEVRDL